MPLYEYKCDRCEKHLEVLQRHNDPPPTCSECDIRMAKQISRTNFALKGGGWYKDHYGLKPSTSNSQD